VEDDDPVVKASALAKFAAQLRAWRQRSGWSQAELAEKLLCSDSLVSGVETMNKTPTLGFVKRLDQAFDLPDTLPRATILARTVPSRCSISPTPIPSATAGHDRGITGPGGRIDDDRQPAPGGGIAAAGSPTRSSARNQP
jgi:transcriptional regulator with XRE-family HTH domain